MAEDVVAGDVAAGDVAAGDVAAEDVAAGTAGSGAGGSELAVLLQALAFIDRPGAVPVTADGTLELVLPDWQWRRRTWRPHPACGCGAAIRQAGSTKAHVEREDGP